MSPGSYIEGKAQQFSCLLLQCSCFYRSFLSKLKSPFFVLSLCESCSKHLVILFFLYTFPRSTLFTLVLVPLYGMTRSTHCIQDMQHSKQHTDILPGLSNSPKQFLYHGSQCQDFRLLFSCAFILLKSSCCILIICKPEKFSGRFSLHNFQIFYNFFQVAPQSFFFVVTFIILCSFFGIVYALFHFPQLNMTSTFWEGCLF